MAALFTPLPFIRFLLSSLPSHVRLVIASAWLPTLLQKHRQIERASVPSNKETNLNHNNLLRFTRGRGASPRGPRGGKTGRAKVAEVVPPAPLGLVVGQFLASDLPRTISAEKTLGITDVETIASFNCLDKADAYITVPGMPPKWTPLDQPRKLELEQDSGTYYRDKNAAHYPDFPLEASVEAIMKMNSDADKASYPGPIDVFGCAIEVVGTTVHFIRREKSPREIIQDVLGYGHTFPENYTTWDKSVRGSASHQRILKYHFGGLTLLVRFEGDGYLPDHARPSLFRSASSEKAVGAASVDDDLFASLSVSHKSLSSNISLTISDGGRLVSPRATFDLKTKAEEAKTIAARCPVSGSGSRNVGILSTRRGSLESWLANHGTIIDGKNNEKAGQLEQGSGDELGRINLDYTACDDECGYCVTNRSERQPLTEFKAHDYHVHGMKLREDR
ncbi:hypothetical protein NQ176_g6541 [Zarea fungicola]|uniref:Uncharacterized protein n=1 Tax=Zarea fungicola TaxID=93591 RepID=A0ACC1N508_9HYPO|nr:hypothetical protein NQ176_g6541 [Lecanicillium fungicola]